MFSFGRTPLIFLLLLTSLACADREAERIEAERIEAERIEAERIEAERIEAERIEAERIEAERIEAERIEAERMASSSGLSDKASVQYLAQLYGADPISTGIAIRLLRDAPGDDLEKTRHGVVSLMRKGLYYKEFRLYTGPVDEYDLIHLRRAGFSPEKINTIIEARKEAAIAAQKSNSEAYKHNREIDKYLVAMKSLLSIFGEHHLADEGLRLGPDDLDDVSLCLLTALKSKGIGFFSYHNQDYPYWEYEGPWLLRILGYSRTLEAIAGAFREMSIKKAKNNAGRRIGGALIYSFLLELSAIDNPREKRNRERDARESYDRLQSNRDMMPEAMHSLLRSWLWVNGPDGGLEYSFNFKGLVFGDDGYPSGSWGRIRRYFLATDRPGVRRHSYASFQDQMGKFRHEYFICPSCICGALPGDIKETNRYQLLLHKQELRRRVSSGAEGLDRDAINAELSAAEKKWPTCLEGTYTARGIPACKGMHSSLWEIRNAVSGLGRADDHHSCFGFDLDFDAWALLMLLNGRSDLGNRDFLPVTDVVASGVYGSVDIATRAIGDLGYHWHAAQSEQAKNAILKAMDFNKIFALKCIGAKAEYSPDAWDVGGWIPKGINAHNRWYLVPLFRICAIAIYGGITVTESGAHEILPVVEDAQPDLSEIDFYAKLLELLPSSYVVNANRNSIAEYERGKYIDDPLWWAVQSWYLSALYRSDKEAFAAEWEVFEIMEPKYGRGVVDELNLFHDESIVKMFEELGQL